MLYLTACGVLLLLLLSGCASSARFGGKDTDEKAKKKENSQSEAKPSASASHSGKPLLTLTGVASYYGKEFHGRKTSNGETFDMYDKSAAHRVFPFKTLIRVTNLDNGKIVVVRVNDRGPFVEGRIIDLSYGAAKELDMLGSGTAKVRLEVLEWGDGT